MKKLFIILALFGVLSCNKSNSTIDSNDLPRIQFNIVRIGNHQYLVYEPGFPNGLMCHYEDCDNPEHHHTTIPDTTTNLLLQLNHNWWLQH